MACTAEYIEFLCSQLEGTGAVRSRKMFGDYCIYIDEKPIILACDGIAYIKRHEALNGLMCDAEIGVPYEGAKEHYILDIEHRERLHNVIATLLPHLPYPKTKSRAKATSKPSAQPKKQQ